MNKNNGDQKTSWGKESEWYDKMLSAEDSYQNKVILPNLLRILDIKKGERALDLGCGQGFFAREVAIQGANVSAIDISPELIKIAEDKQQKNSKDQKNNVAYAVASADETFPFEDNYFEKIFCVLSLQNMKDAETFFSESARVLKKDGKIVLVLNHPAFRVPKGKGGGSEWGFEETKDKYGGNQYRKVYEYMSEKKVEIDMHPGENQKEKGDMEKSKNRSLTYSFHRPLQLYFKYFAKNNFAVIRLEEWISHKESEKGPRKQAEDKARKEIPLFMMIEGKKI